MSSQDPSPLPVKSNPPVRKSTRTIRVADRMNESGVIMVTITERTARTQKQTHYFLTRMSSDWGYAVQWEKSQASGGDGECYQCCIANDGFHNCTCLGFERYGYCKHTSATQALLSAGKLESDL